MEARQLNATRNAMGPVSLLGPSGMLTLAVPTQSLQKIDFPYWDGVPIASSLLPQGKGLKLKANFIMSL